MNRVVIIFCLLSLCPITASAQSAPTSLEIEAQTSFREGQKLYEQQQYEQALALFRESYIISGDPDSLLSIARCYHSLGRYQEALETLRSFLFAVPETPLRPQIEKEIYEIQALLPQAELPPRPAEPPPFAKRKPPKPPLWAYSIPGGFAGLGTGLGVGAMLLASEIASLKGDPEGTDGAVFRQRSTLAISADLSFVIAGVSLFVIQKRVKESK